jgi:hypothetical protein
MRSLILAATMAAMIAPAVAGDQIIPQAVKTAFQEVKKDCGEEFKTKRGFFMPREINGDGVDDFILNYEHVTCGGREANFCGTGGCFFQVIASRKEDNDYVKVMQDHAFAVHFKKLNGRHAMIQYQHGTHCRLSGAEGPCMTVNYWGGWDFSPAVPVRSIPAR